MGERFNVWWESMENTWIPTASIGFKSIILMLVMWFVLCEDNPWYTPLPLHDIIIVKIGLILLFLGFAYTDIKKVYIYYKNIFKELRGRK